MVYGILRWVDIYSVPDQQSFHPDGRHTNSIYISYHALDACWLLIPGIMVVNNQYPIAIRFHPLSKTNIGSLLFFFWLSHPNTDQDVPSS